MATKTINQMVNEVVDSKTLVFYFTHRLQARLNRLHKNYPKRTVQALDKNAKRERECGQYIWIVITRVRTNIAIAMMNMATINNFDYHSVLSLPSLGLPE